MYKLIKFNINGRDVELNVDVRKSLLEVIRNDLGLVGSKEACGVGECGACTVKINDEAIDSCIYLAVWADGKTITTIEGITHKDGSLTDVQRNFIDAGAVQCGFCTPGLIMSSSILLETNKMPTRQEIRRGLSGNLCRCTGYSKIINAVENTAKERN